MKPFWPWIAGAAVLLVLVVAGVLVARRGEKPRPTAAVAGSEVTTVALNVEGMTCGACAFGVEAALKRLPGVEDAQVDHASGKASVTVAKGGVTTQELVVTINGLGYRAAVPGS